MPRQHTLPSRPDHYGERLDPEMARISRLQARKLARHPLIVYSAFVTVSLLLLGSMAVASLPH